MRIWDVSPKILCRTHLIAEHRELHAVWVILTEGRQGYRNHPETRRWAGKLRALFTRHEQLVKEMKRRGYNHRTPLPKRHAIGTARQRVYVNTIAEQLALLAKKPCDCPIALSKISKKP